MQILFLAVFLASTCVHASSQELSSLSPAEREDHLRRAQLWESVAIEERDLFAGPQGKGAYAFGQEVSCAFVPGRAYHGGTPKFFCADDGGQEFKVKYASPGIRNGEIYSEVAGTRLFWALGFKADRMYPVRVHCRDCPADPFHDHDGSAGRADRDFDPADIEHKTGKEISSYPDQGWSWDELGRSAAPAEQLDAYRLLAAFVQHVDSKADNQRLMCLDKDIEQGAGGRARCAHPWLMIQDLGAVFGASSDHVTDTSKFDLKAWASKPVWADPKRCVAEVVPGRDGSLERPRISEAGRAFLAGLLGRLSDRQIEDLFRVARAKDSELPHWVDTFKAKRAEIADRRCPN